MPLRILAVCNTLPYPARGGAQLRALNLLKRVAQVHSVTLCCHAWSDADEESARELGKRGMRVFTGRLTQQADFGKAIGAARFALTGKPPELALYRSAELVAVLRELLRTETFDILQIEEVILAHYAELLPAGSGTRTLLDIYDVRHVQAARAAPLERPFGMRLWRRLNGVWMRFYEAGLARRFDRCVVVSENDRQSLAGLRRRHEIEVVPNGVDTAVLQPLRPAPAPPSLLFVGSMFYKPCEDAAVWLVRDILPLVRRVFPRLVCWLVGKAPGARVTALAGENVIVTGEVDDIVPYYLRSSIAAAPLRAGSGSRLKILEAMALSRPVVSTTIGAEGLDIEPEKHLLAGDTAEAFAAAVIRLLQSPELVCSITRSARALVEERYNWEMIANHLLRIHQELAQA